MAGREFYARFIELKDGQLQWQLLDEHLKGVATRAGEFCAAFDSKEWGLLLGFLHDLGKLQPAFQSKLAGERVSVEHSGAGAALVFEKAKDRGLPLAFAIAGHHAGLANFADSEKGQPTPLSERLKENRKIVEDIRRDIPVSVQDLRMPAHPAFLRIEPGADPVEMARTRRRSELWTRFLFSALVDADRLDSESFGNPETGALRGSRVLPADLRAKLDEYVNSLNALIQPELRHGKVNRAREEVHEACRRAAEEKPGFFSLTVPTGGGKTLASMAFALKHAEIHSLRRVFVVIPFTSIIEQSAEAYRKALGDECVLEHHSNLDPEASRRRLSMEAATSQELATENWDAPIIVTTSVQFFETLFSNRPSRCRRLHRMARSVVILDEVQTLPPSLLLCILEALRDLVECYGCSVVLSTATPPALARRESLPQGIEPVRPIIASPEQLSRTLARVEYAFPAKNSEPVSWDALAMDIAGRPSALAVVHRRADARELADAVGRALPGEEIFHLSALMCPRHRSDTIARVKRVLASGEPCHLVSTQLIEAGVCLDFPVVYRALGGLDSIVQAAGRCNREGKLAKGQVIVFKAPTMPPQGVPRQALQVTEAMLSGGSLDLDDPRILETYFRMLYQGQNLDAKGIQPLRETLSFASVADRFEMIEDGFSRSLVVPYGDSPERIAKLRSEGPSRSALRALQPFVVNVYKGAFEKLCDAGALEEVAGCVNVLTVPYAHLYDGRFGLKLGDEISSNPEALII